MTLFLVLIILTAIPSGKQSDSCFIKNNFSEYIYIDSLKHQKLVLIPERITLKQEYVEYEGTYKVIITSLLSNDTLQILYGKIYRIDFEEIEFADANFDGIQDILVMTNYSYSGRNNDHDIWIYNNEKRMYMYDSLLSVEIGCNPGFDSTNKIYTTVSDLGCLGMCYACSKYKFVKGKLLLIEDETQDRISNNYDITDDRYIRILKVRRGKRMVIIQKKTGTLEDIESKWDYNYANPYYQRR